MPAVFPRAASVLTFFLGVCLVTAQGALSASLPPVGAAAMASASAPGPGGSPSPASESGQPVSASALVTANGDDFAQGEAFSAWAGVLRSRSQAGGASGSVLPSSADASASWISGFAAVGTNPGSPVDVDLTITLDGTLGVSNNNGGAGPGDVAAGVGLVLTVYDASGATTVFSGDAELATVTNDTPPALARHGDWAAAGRDGDFTESFCSRFSCEWAVAATIDIPDALLVGFGTTFAVGIELSTDAFTFAGREVDADADFLNTGVVAISTSTPGVSFVLVPEPGLGTLGPLALLGLGLRRARTDRPGRTG